MIIDLNIKLTNSPQDYYFKPLSLIRQTSEYREVYLTKLNFHDNTEYELVVYDLNSLPENFPEDYIPEFKVHEEMPSNIIPNMIEKGIYKDEKHNIAWMVKKRIKGQTLTEHLKSGFDIDKKAILYQYLRIVKTTEMISKIFDGGCVNNINPDNIILEKDENPEDEKYSYYWFLVDLDCVSGRCHNKKEVFFNTERQNALYRAPETFLGKYNPQTDVFSLGMILAYAMQGKHPWEEQLIDERSNLSTRYIKTLKEKSPDIDFDISFDLREIMIEAICPNHKNRHIDVESFHEQLEAISVLNDDTKIILEDEDEGIWGFNSDQPKTNVTFDKVKGNGFKDVAGMLPLKRQLTRNFIDIMQNKELAKKFNIMPPNGLLLWGPPGNGKTFISRKLAEESDMIFCMIKPSDLGNIFVHGSQKLIADLFSRSEKIAKKNKCGVLLVFDEFDSLVPKRDGNNTRNYQADEVAEFLTQLNDCSEKNIYVVATTNRLDAIDPAIIRKGRIDEIVYVGMPDDEARTELLRLEIDKRPHEDIDMKRITELTKGFSASDISFIIKECARISFEESIKKGNLVKISQELIEKTITNTRPSITSEELSKYEAMRDNFSKSRRQDRKRIGFNA
jgi:transitional endoplasmic reticulum ATPase